MATLALATILALTPDRASAALPIAVNSTLDRPDRSIGDGVCATVGGGCTLRAAIQETNALLGQDTIHLGPGVYELEIPVVNEDTQSTGDHDIADTVNIVGTGAGATFIDGGFPAPSAPIEARGIDRLFEIHPSAGNVTFRSLSIQDGFYDEGGGGIQNWSPGLLKLENVHLLNNLAAKSGGGLTRSRPCSTRRASRQPTGRRSPVPGPRWAKTPGGLPPPALTARSTMTSLSPHVGVRRGADRPARPARAGGEDRIVPPAHPDWLMRHCPRPELWLRPRDRHVSVLGACPLAMDWLESRVEP